MSNEAKLALNMEWEYLILRAEEGRTEAADARGWEVLHEFELDEWGSEGWELVSCGYDAGGNLVTAVLKREALK